MKKLLLILLFLLILLLCSTTFSQFQQKPLLGEQLNWAHPLSQGLVLYLPFNEGSGNKVYDLSGNSNTGPLGGNVAWTVGKFGHALDFPGDAADAIEPGKVVFDCAKPFAISFWMNADSFAAQDAIITKYAGGAPGFLIRRDDAAMIDLWLSSTTIQLNSVVNSGTWYHVFVTYDGAKTYAYINAILDSATPATKTLTDISLSLQIGKSSLGNYDGQLDNLMIWQRYFSASEIALLYRNPFCMFEKDDVALMAVDAAPPSVVPTPYYYLRGMLFIPIIPLAYYLRRQKCVA